MRDFATTPSIDVTIGRQTRFYHAFVTTAPPTLDSPSTVTLYTSTLVDLAGFAATDISRDILASAGHCDGRARLVLVDARELAWHRARCRGNHFILAPADPVLVSLTSLQHWLWQRLQAPPDHDDVEGAGDNDTTAA
jgi:hypothetical protein